MCPKCLCILCVLQTKSEAAEELERFRKASEGGQGTGPRSCPSTPSVTCTSPVFTPPPTPLLMPQPAMNAHPPPPPVLLLEKASSNTPANPALAREAMLEAIRSGTAADKLKKVKCAPVSTNDQDPLSILVFHRFSDVNTKKGVNKDKDRM